MKWATHVLLSISKKSKGFAYLGVDAFFFKVAVVCFIKINFQEKSNIFGINLFSIMCSQSYSVWIFRFECFESCN